MFATLILGARFQNPRVSEGASQECSLPWYLGSTATETRTSARVHPRNVRYPDTGGTVSEPERQRGCIPGMFATLVLGKHGDRNPSVSEGASQECVMLGQTT